VVVVGVVVVIVVEVVAEVAVVDEVVDVVVSKMSGLLLSLFATKKSIEFRSVLYTFEHIYN
jgi:hypothetical protein